MKNLLILAALAIFAAPALANVDPAPEPQQQFYLISAAALERIEAELRAREAQIKQLRERAAACK